MAELEKNPKNFKKYLLFEGASSPVETEIFLTEEFIIYKDDDTGRIDVCVIESDYYSYEVQDDEGNYYTMDGWNEGLAPSGLRRLWK